MASEETRDYDEGYGAGYGAGHDEGYDEGYDAGYAECHDTDGEEAERRAYEMMQAVLGLIDERWRAADGAELRAYLDSLYRDVQDL